MRGRWHPSLGREPSADELDRLMGLDVEKDRIHRGPRQDSEPLVRPAASVR